MHAYVSEKSVFVHKYFITSMLLHAYDSDTVDLNAFHLALDTCYVLIRISKKVSLTSEC